MDLSRRDIVLTDLEPVEGSEQGKKRSGLIVQNDKGNRYSSTTVVAPVTSSYSSPYPFEVEIESSKSCLEKDSVILTNQIRTVSIEHRLEKKIGEIRREKMREVDEALRISLELR